MLVLIIYVYETFKQCTFLYNVRSKVAIMYTNQQYEYCKREFINTESERY